MFAFSTMGLSLFFLAQKRIAKSDLHHALNERNDRYVRIEWLARLEQKLSTQLGAIGITLISEAYR